MKFPRAAGVLLHPTSLPGANGIGEFGPDALRFLDFMVDAGLTIWQMLPLGPTGFGDSPYQCFSAFAGNPLLIHVAGASTGASLPERAVDFPCVIEHKRQLLVHAVRGFKPHEAFHAFVVDEASWLEDYALFMALKEAHRGAAWPAWPRELSHREPAALEHWRRDLEQEVHRIKVEQYLFFSQLQALKRAAAERGISLMGDLPIYVAHDSACVWSNRHLFRLHDDGSLVVQAGVPPDYFSATGQLWGNPLYDWEALKASGYDWWIRRLRSVFQQVDIVRIDHFRGFDAYWEVPGDAVTAIDGRWVKGPGIALFEALTKALGPLPIVAENLGNITPDVEALREACGFPGMSILQFAFGTDAQAKDFQPHTYPRERVVYTGTHDNDTTVGWWTAGTGDTTRSAEDVEREHAFAKRYLNTDGHEMHWTLIRTVLASVADTVLIPMQDILGMGSEARMNLPGRPSGNWQFRFSWEQLTSGTTARLRDLITTYDR